MSVDTKDTLHTLLSNTYKNVSSTFLKGYEIGKNTEVIMSNENQDKIVELISREVSIPEIAEQINEFIDAALNVPDSLLEKTEMQSKIGNININTNTNNQTGFRSNQKGSSNKGAIKKRKTKSKIKQKQKREFQSKKSKKRNNKNK